MRKTAIVTITDEGRDKGKVFKITEMPAAQAEKWGIRALLVLQNAGVELPETVKGSGLAGVATLGAAQFFKLPFDDIEPLLDEMMGCVMVIRDPAHPETAFPLVSDDIEEIPTRLKLRAEVIKLHLDFLSPAAKQKLTSGLASAGL